MVDDDDDDDDDNDNYDIVWILHWEKKKRSFNMRSPVDDREKKI